MALHQPARLVRSIAPFIDLFACKAASLPASLSRHPIA
jgi:hypothetical protein